MLGDHRGYNLLMLAVDLNNSIAVDALISLKIFNLSEKISGVNAVDLAWSKGNFDITLSLLNSNSIYPTNFDESSASQEIKEFVGTCDKLHELITAHSLSSDNSQLISEVIDLKPNLIHFFNKKNQSAAFEALSQRKQDIYDLLASKNVVISRTTDKISEILQDYSPTLLKNVRDIQKKYARPLPKKHIMKLMIHSFVGFDDFDSDERFIHVLDAYNVLDGIPWIQPLLELVSNAEKLDVFFEFNHDFIDVLDPTQDSGSNGLFYPSGVVYVAAKQLLDPTRKFEAIAVLAHELCHFAMFMVYRNMAEPYAIGDLAAERDFHDVLNDCRQVTGFEEIVDGVFANYAPSVFHAELIVRIPHMLAFYVNDEYFIQFCRGAFSSLFNHFEMVVLPQVRATIPVIERLAEDRDINSVTWGVLTAPLQAAIKNEDVSFQDFDVDLCDILGDDSAAYEKLSSNQIVMLLKGKVVKLAGSIPCEFPFYVERKIHEIEKEVESAIPIEDYAKLPLKFLLMSDYAGHGKTVALKEISKQYKVNFPQKWIQFIDLKSHFDAYEGCKKDLLTLDDISNFLADKILKLKDFEAKVFSELFKTGNVILIFDGVDEISPSFNNFASKLFKSIHYSSKNHQVVSTRPEYSEVLEELLNVKAYKLKPFGQYKRRMFIEKCLSSQNLDDDKLKERLDLVNNWVANISQGKSGKSEHRKLDSPMLLQMIVKFCEKEDQTQISYYKAFDFFFTTAIEKIDKKGKEVKKVITKQTKSKVTITEVHQRYALMNIFGKSFEDLQIMKKRMTWRKDDINIYGILFIKTGESFNFSHRMHAEFFCAKYIIDNILEEENYLSEEEAKLRLFLLFEASHAKKYPEVQRFIENYLDSKDSERVEFNPVFEELDFNYAHYHDMNFTFLSRLFRGNDKMFRKLWKFDEPENCLVYSVRANLDHVEKFFKDVQKNLTQEEIEELLNIGNQRGNVLYNLWSRKRRLNFDMNLLNMSDEVITEVVNLPTFEAFMAKMETILTDVEFKEMISRNVWKFLIKHYLDSLENFKKFCDLIVEKSIDIKKMALILNIFLKFSQREFLKCKDDVFESIFEKYNDFFDESDISSMVFIPEISQRNYLAHTVEKKLFNRSKIIWRLLDSKLSSKEKKTFLLQTDKEELTSFHYAVLYNDSEVFEYFREIYMANFKQDEVKNIFKSPSSFILKLKVSGIDKNIYFEYFNTLFVNNQRELNDQAREFLFT